MTSDPLISQLLALVEASAARGDDIAAMRDALRAQTTSEDLDSLLDLADDLEDADRFAELCAVLLACAGYESIDERRCVQLFDASAASARAGNYAMALECADAGARLGGSPADVRRCAELHWWFRHVDEAEAMLERSMRGAPLDASSWFLKGLLSRSRLAWQDAIASFRRAIELGGREVRYLRALAGVLVGVDIAAETTEHVAEAEAILLSKVVVDVPDYWTSIYTAQLFWLKRDEARSTRALRAAQRLSPDQDLLSILLLGYYRIDWGHPWPSIARVVRELFDAYEAARARSDAEDAESALSKLERLLARAKHQHPEALRWIRRLERRDTVRLVS